MEKTDLIISTLALFEANYGVKLDTMYRAFLVKKLQPLPEDVISDVFDSVISNYSRTAKNDRYKLYSAYPDWAIIKSEIDKVYHVPSEQDRAEMKSESAWKHLLSSIETYGSYRMPDFDPTLAYCVRSLGGWSVVCNWRESDLNWRKKEFMELYALADGKADLLEAGPEAIESLSRHAIGQTSTKEALGGFMQSLKERNMKAISNG